MAPVHWWIVPYLITCSAAAVIQQPLLGDFACDELPDALKQLEQSLGRVPGDRCRIKHMEPVAKPCYSIDDKGATIKQIETCKDVTSNRTSDVFMTDKPGSYYFGNWATCHRTGDTCALPSRDDAWDPDGPKGAWVSNASTCRQGGVPDWYIDIHGADDVKQAFERASEYKLPIVIKNTGHDWKGRSSGPGALALWTHRLQQPRTNMTLIKEFSATGCNDSIFEPYVIKFGAGEQWGGVYKFANEKGLMVVGGTCPTVGAAGWLAGGGHSPLTPSFGMGVDNVRQVRIVTPKYGDIIVNRCQHPDLFTAIKGGGGGTYGVVMEIWYKAMNRTGVQEFTLSLWGLDQGLMRRFFEILTDHATDWAAAGWGGYINTNRQKSAITIMNPRMTKDAAYVSMSPLIQFARHTGLNHTLQSHESWYDYFNRIYSDPANHRGNWATAVSSRLIPPTLFNENLSRVHLVDMLLDLHYSRLNLWIMLVTPSAFTSSTLYNSALHPSWRSATWLVRVNDRWDSFYDAATPRSSYENFQRVHHALDRLRDLTPNMGVSINEADIWEKDHELAFWGKPSYEALVEVKKQYDPQDLLSVYQGVRARKDDTKFKCYPKEGEF